MLKFFPGHDSDSWLFYLVDKNNKIQWEFPGHENKGYPDPIHTPCNKRYGIKKCKHKIPKKYLNLWKIFLMMELDISNYSKCLCFSCKNKKLSLIDDDWGYDEMGSCKPCKLDFGVRISVSPPIWV